MTTIKPPTTVGPYDGRAYSDALNPLPRRSKPPTAVSTKSLKTRKSGRSGRARRGGGSPAVGLKNQITHHRR